MKMKLFFILPVLGLLKLGLTSVADDVTTAMRDDQDERSLLSCYVGYCYNTGVCFGNMKCVCAKGYSGPRCQNSDTRSPCLPDPCPFGEQCQPTPDMSSYTCIVANPCEPTPCPSGTRCTVIGTSYRCDSTNPCVQNPCPSGTRCVPLAGGRSCEPFFPNPCMMINPCPAGTTCTPVGASRNCVPNNQCLNNPCPAGTECIPKGLYYECRSSKTACAVNQCRNGCVCTPSCRHEEGYYCKGSNGYIGKNCDIPAPTVSCERKQMIINVDEAILREYSPGNDLILVVGQNGEAGGCVLNKYGNRYTITVPVGAGGSSCGISQSKSIQNLQYDATLWMKLRNAVNYDIPIPLLKIKCNYVAEYSVSTSLQPQIELPRMITGQGLVTKGSISLCKVGSSCPSACPANYLVTGGGVYTVGEMIHLNIRTGINDPIQKAALERLYLSCDSTMNSLAVVDLVNQGCTSSATHLHTTISHNAQSDCVCVSFQVPKLDNCQQVFIHAKLADCTGRSLETCPASNTQSCVGIGEIYPGRRRRDANETLDQIFGPIYFIPIKRTESESILFPDEDLFPVEALLPRAPHSSAASTQHIFIALAVVSFVFCIFIILCVLCVIKKLIISQS